jgi:hypothetical protein
VTTTIAHASIERTCALICFARTADLTSDCFASYPEVERRCRQILPAALRGQGGVELVVGLEG